MSVSTPVIKVLVDWTNNPIGLNAVAGNNFVNISSYVRLDQTLNIGRGRQDNISAVQPARCSFTVDNSTGNFTPGNTASPWYPGVLIGRRIQISVQDESGVYHVRFDGQIAEIDINDTPTGMGATATIVCADAIAYLNRYPEFDCWTVEQCDSLNPIVQYVLREPAGALGVSDAQGNGPTLPLSTFVQPLNAQSNSGNYSVSAATATFQSGNNPVEAAVEPTTWTAETTPVSAAVSSPLPSIQFGATISGSGGNAVWGPSAQFQGPLPSPVTINGSTGYTLLAWAWPDVGLANIYNLAYNQIIAALSNTRTGQMTSIQTNTAGTASSFGYYGSSFYNNFLVYGAGGAGTGHLGSYGWFNGPVMVALVINGTTATLYVGGNLYGIGNTLLTATGTMTIPSGTVFNQLSIGGPIGGGYGFLGNISNVCLYEQALTTGQLGALALTGAYGPALTSVGGNMTNLLSFAGLPSYWTGQLDQGAVQVDFFDLTGNQPSAAIQTIQSADLGLLFADATGKVNYHSRGRREGAPAPVTTLPAGSYNPGIAPKWNDQYLQNSVAIQSERGGTATTAQNATSIAQYGPYANGTLNSPTQIPLFNWVGAFGQRQLANAGTYEFTNLYDQTPFGDTAAWPVNTASQPGMKLATITVDILSNKTGHNEYVAPSTLYGLEIDQCFAIGENLPWWPNVAEASELFIEGINETYSTTEAAIQFYTSPAYQSRGWVPGDATYGKLDVSARVGANNTNIVSPYTTPNVPTFSSTMNNTDAGVTTNGYVAASDLRGISSNLQAKLQPPLLFTQQALNTQSIPTSTNTYIVWDTTVVDTSGMMNQYVNGSTAAQIWTQGWYEIYLTVQFAANATGDRRIWIVQNQTYANRGIAPIEAKGSGSAGLGLTTSAVIWCATGDALGALVWQDSGSALATSTGSGGSHMSLRYLGSGSNRN